MLTDKEKEDLLNNIDILKRLIILLLIKQDVDQKDIAKALGITPGTLSKILNPGKYRNS